MSVAEAPPAQVTRARGRRRARREFDRPRFLWVFLGLFYLWLFAPIAVVALFSFNAQNSLQVFSGFSLRWYDAFFSDPGLRSSLMASLEISLVATLVGTVLGTTLAFGLVRARSRIAPTANVLMLIPLVTPEIVAGVSALLLFTQVGLQLSLTTVILAQITFSISYVTVVVRARLSALNREVEQAAMDLGATRLQTLRLVTLPALWPAIIAASLLVFALTFDDFVLSFFTTGVSPQPLPVRIYSAIRFGIKPTINAVGTFMLVISMLLVLLALVLPWLMSRRGSSIATVMGEETGGRR
jgi:spermidine/putrescine transport system permease protein/putrescine transport system permease protein